jgi:uncharacterized protein
MLKNAVNWLEIPASDIHRAKAFYEALFQYEMVYLDLGVLEMALFQSDPNAVGAAICQHPEFYQPGPNGPLVYLDGNPDLGIILNRVPDAGGKIIIPKRQISPEQGFMSVFIDSEGNRVGLRSRA